MKERQLFEDWESPRQRENAPSVRDTVDFDFEADFGMRAANTSTY